MVTNNPPLTATSLLTQDSPAPVDESSFVTLRDFFESVAPGSTAQVKQRLSRTHQTGDTWDLDLPDIELHCTSPSCEGDRIFNCRFSPTIGKRGNVFITFGCKNCESYWKTYAVRVEYDPGSTILSVEKFGERPQFGPPVPPKVRALLGQDGDYFFKGYRAERQGMGVAAFVYYRRIVENQKSKIFGEIIRVAETLGESAKLIEELRTAQIENQFTKAVDGIKNAIPQALRIQGHNPLTLLHSALSEGVHNNTDEQCLALATSIRLVLFDFVERVSSVLKDETQLKSAIGILAAKKGKA
jgi:hypothetical protein